MFEKEAEEKYCKGCKLRMEQCLWAWRKTNGLKEPNEKNCSCKEVPTYIRGAEFGYNKANEWHYPSKGEYPKDEKNVLCILGEFENINLEVGYYSQRENERERWRFSEYSTPDDSKDDWGVSAWKEIVLPELPKESE